MSKERMEEVKEQFTISKINANAITTAKIDANNIAYNKEFGVFYPKGQEHLIQELYLEKKLFDLKVKTLEGESDET